MSVQVQTPISGPYTANGSTKQFAYKFYLLLESDLEVYVGGTKKILNTDYTVTGVGTSAGGNVNFNTAPAAGLEVLLKRVTPYRRDTDYADNGDLLADVLNDDFDRLWLALQEINANFSSSISRPVGGDWNADSKRITGMADGTQPQDAVTYKQLFTVNGNASQAAQTAQAAAQQTALDRQQTGQDRTATAASAEDALDSQNLAKRWASETVGTVVDGGLYSARHYASKAADSATAAGTSASGASTSAQSAAQSATTATQQAAGAAQSAQTAQTEAAKLGNMNQLAAAISSIVNNDVTWRGKQTVLAEGANDGDLVTVRQLRAATAAGGSNAGLINGVLSNFIGAVEWWNGSTTTYPSGFLPADGQLLNRADYPELWAAINSGLLSSVSDSIWLNGVSSEPNEPGSRRGMYSTGNGSTTFRMPDLNGNWTDGNSVPGIYLRGRKNAWSTPNGGIRRSQAPNIVGALGVGSFKALLGHKSIAVGDGSGAFRVTGAGDQPLGSGSDAYRFFQYDMDASRASPVYSGPASPGVANYTDELRPNSAFGTWLIRVNGSFTAANTSFSVLNGVTTAPANGTTVVGGELYSRFRVNGVDHSLTRVRAMANISSAGAVTRYTEIASGDGTNTAAWGLFEDGGLVTPGNGLLLNKAPRYTDKATGAQALMNAGISGTAANGVGKVVIPISTSQALCIQSGSSVVTLNSSGEATFTFPTPFVSQITFLATNGDANVTGSDVVDSITSWSANNAAVYIRVRRINTTGQQATTPAGPYRMNWYATGLVNL